MQLRVFVMETWLETLIKNKHKKVLQFPDTHKYYRYANEAGLALRKISKVWTGHQRFQKNWHKANTFQKGERREGDEILFHSRLKLSCIHPIIIMANVPHSELYSILGNHLSSSYWTHHIVIDLLGVSWHYASLSNPIDSNKQFVNFDCQQMRKRVAICLQPHKVTFKNSMSWVSSSLQENWQTQAHQQFLPANVL